MTGRNGAIDNLSGNNVFNGSISLWDIAFSGGATIGAASGTQLTLNGVVSGSTAAAALTVGGAGTVFLGNSNTYTGNTTVNAGATLVAANSTALGANNVGTVSVATNATLGLQGGIAISKDTPGTSRLTLNGTGVSGAGALRNISGNNTWAGDITLGSATTIVSATAGNTLSLGNGSRTDTLTMGANTLIVGGAGNTTFYTYVGAVGDTGSFTLNGTTATATTTFTGYHNNYTGLTTVNQGILVLDTSSAPPDYNLTIQGNLVIGDGAGGASNAIVRFGSPANSNKIADGSTVTINADGLLDLNGNVDKIGALILTGGQVATGTGYLQLGGDVTSNAAGNTAVIDGIIHLDNASRTFNVATGGDLTVKARVDNGSIVKTGAGTMYLTHDNITGGGYTGTVTVSAGVLNISNGNALGTTAGSTTVSGTGAALQVQGNIAVGAESLIINGLGIDPGSGYTGALRNISGDNSWAGTVTAATAARINSDPGSSLTLAGNIAAAANLAVGGAGNTTFSGTTIALNSLTKDGSGILTITGATNYAGVLPAITVNAGKLQIGSSGAGGALTGSPNVTLANNNTAIFDIENGQTNTIGTLTANANSTLTIGSGTLITSGGTIAGAFTSPSGTGTLKTNGSLTITSGSTYAGTLEVAGGTLDLTGMGAGFSIGTLIIDAGTTLKLGANQLNVTNLQINGASTIDFNGAGAATLKVTNLSTSAAITAGQISITSWANGVDYFYAQSWGTETINTRGTPEEQKILFSGFTTGNTAWLSYDPGDSDHSKRQVTPAPEPSTYGAIFMGLSLVGLGFRRWRARRQP
jgi:autotransporter-associated beta strand protein